MVKYQEGSLNRSLYQDIFDKCTIIVGEFESQNTLFGGVYYIFDGIDGRRGNLLSYSKADFTELVDSIKAIKDNNYIGKLIIPFGWINLKLVFKGLTTFGTIKVRSYLSFSLLYFSGFFISDEVSKKQLDELISALLTAKDELNTIEGTFGM